MTNKRPQLIAANDNHAPRYADSFENDLASRRAWLATLPTKTKPVLAWPTLERLRDMRTVSAVAALFAYRDLMAPAHDLAANENDPDATSMDADRRLVIRPSDSELFGAVEEILENDEEPGDKDDAGNFRFGRFRFSCTGRMREFVDTKGRTVFPHVRQRGARGQKAPARTESNIRFMLVTDAPIAKGAHFFGGVSMPRGNTRTPDAGQCASETEIQRRSHRTALRRALGVHYCKILDMALTDSTAREVGEALGFKGDYAERKAVALIDEALAAFERLTNDHSIKKIAEYCEKLAA